MSGRDSASPRWTLLPRLYERRRPNSGRFSGSVAHGAAAPVLFGSCALDAVERRHPVSVEPTFLGEVSKHGRQQCIEVVRGGFRKGHHAKSVANWRGNPRKARNHQSLDGYSKALTQAGQCGSKSTRLNSVFPQRTKKWRRLLSFDETVVVQLAYSKTLFAFVRIAERQSCNSGGYSSTK